MQHLRSTPPFYLVLLSLMTVMCGYSALADGHAYGSIARGPPSEKYLAALQNLGEIADDVKIVADKSTLDFTESIDPERFPNPWADASVNVYTSVKVAQVLDAGFLEEVPGLGKTTFQEVFDVLRAAKCPVYILGGMVRDSLLGRPAKDTDIAFACDATDVARIAADNGWECSKPKRGYIKLGHEEPGKKDQLEGKDAGTSLYQPLTALEYACNALFYDTNTKNKAIIDRVNGVPDVLNKMTRIPVAADLRDEWSSGKLGLKKLFRLWKMRIAPKLFGVDPDTLAYVKARLEQLFKEDAQKMSKLANDFFASRIKGIPDEKGAFTLYSLRHAMIEDLTKTWFDKYLDSTVPDCPYNRDKAVEAHVGKFLPLYKAAFAKMKSMAGPTNGHVSGRLRSTASVWKECRPLGDVKDIAGVRVTMSNEEDFTELRDAVMLLDDSEREVVNDDSEKPRSDGYRSFDFYLNNPEGQVEVQIRTPYMSHWSEWIRSVYSAVPSLFDSDTFKTYSTTMAEWFNDLDTERSASMPACPTILKDGAVQNRDVLSTSIRDGCFEWGDLNPVPGESTMDSTFVEHVFDDLQLIGDAADCGPDFPYYSKKEVAKVVHAFVPTYHRAALYVRAEVGHIAHVTYRLKTVDSLYDNLYVKCKLLEDYKDVVGIRATFEDISDLLEGVKLLRARWPDAEVKGDADKVREDGYRGIHVLPTGKDGHKFEIQLRTPFMNSWADWSHDLLYKGEHGMATHKDTVAYSMNLAKFFLKHDTSRSKYPTCAKEIKDVTLKKDVETDDQTTACFHWPDVSKSILTSDEEPPHPDNDNNDNNEKKAWPSSARYTVGILALLHVIVLVSGILLGCMVVRKLQLHRVGASQRQGLNSQYNRLDDVAGST